MWIGPVIGVMLLALFLVGVWYWARGDWDAHVMLWMAAIMGGSVIMVTGGSLWWFILYLVAVGATICCVRSIARRRRNQ